MKKINTNFITAILITISLLSGCKKFLETELPKDQISSQEIYQNDETATAAIRGIYVQMMTDASFASGGSLSVTLLGGRSADEFINYSPSEFSKQFSDNTLTSNNTELKSGLWQSSYKYIYFANAVLENLQRSSSISTAVKKQLGAEAKFIRAFCHFYLLNLFGSIPLILETDYRKNASAAPSTTELVYSQIIADLIDAKSALSEKYPSGERIRANKYAASALLARVYLYRQQWADAERESSEVIDRSDIYMLSDDLNSVFLKNSKETILQFAPSLISANTNEGAMFILTTAPGDLTQAVLNEGLLKAFEPGDLRASKWIGSIKSGVSTWYFPYKYKIKTGATPRNEYSMVLRLAEQFLIRAESRIRLGRIEEGVADLNLLRKRARSSPTSAIQNPLPDFVSSMLESEALVKVESERRVELFCEWGHRWLDLKRTGRAGSVLRPIKGVNWQPQDELYPIPLSEILINPKLVQNPGY